MDQALTALQNIFTSVRRLGITKPDKDEFLGPEILFVVGAFIHNFDEGNHLILFDLVRDNLPTVALPFNPRMNNLKV